MATKHQFWTSIIHFGTFTGLGLYLAAPGPILKDLEQQTNASLADISYVFSARALGYILGVFMHGAIADGYTQNAHTPNKFNKWNKIYPIRPHHMFFLCILICNVCMICLSLINHLIILGVIITITGICFGGIEIYGSVCILQLFDTDNKNDKLLAPYMNFLHFSFAIGALISPLGIQLSFVIDNGYNIAFYIYTIWNMLFAIPLLLVDTPLRNNIQTDSENTILLNKSNNHSRLPLFMILSCATFIGVYVGCEVAFGGYITTYSDDYLLSSMSNGRFMSSVFWGGLAFGRLISVWIAKHTSAVYMLIIDLIGCVISMLLFIIFDGNMLIGWIASVLFGMFMASIYASIFVVAEKTVKISGKYASFIVFGSSCGEFIIPTLEGNIMDYFGLYYFSIFTIVTIGVLIINLLVIILLKRQIISNVGKILNETASTYGTSK
eukprot:64521_1